MSFSQLKSEAREKTSAINQSKVPQSSSQPGAVCGLRARKTNQHNKTTSSFLLSFLKHYKHYVVCWCLTPSSFFIFFIDQNYGFSPRL
jgi:hypothetical protein